MIFWLGILFVFWLSANGRFAQYRDFALKDAPK